MHDDLISREAVRNIVNDIRDCISVEGYWAILERLKKLPPVNPTKTGHWIDTNSESFEFHRIYKCSECGNTQIEYPENIYRRFRYCPNCGAKMLETQERSDKK
jgi:DNA-directed RNA polymerase subunit RPC12/RpoP